MTLCEFDWRLEVSGYVAFLGTLLVQPLWISRVMDSQAGDSWIQTRKGGDHPRSRLDSWCRWRLENERKIGGSGCSLAQDRVV